MPIDRIINYCNNFYNDSQTDEHSRNHSWEYCYQVFNDIHSKDSYNKQDIDYLCLHLSFYLASWGMYRGSAFLLKRDYKVHETIVKELLKSKYNSLWNIEINKYKDEKTINLLFELVENLKGLYNDIRLQVKEIIPQNEVSDTLITKVLMGTLGCVPAYDRYFTGALKKYKIANGTFGKKSILMLVDFYEKYYSIFEEQRKNMYTSKYKYPQMKILDMGLVELGFNLLENNEKKLLK